MVHLLTIRTPVYARGGRTARTEHDLLYRFLQHFLRIKPNKYFKAAPLSSVPYGCVRSCGRARPLGVRARGSRRGRGPGLRWAVPCRAVPGRAGGGAALGAGPPSVPGQVRQRWARAVRPLRTEPLHARRPAGLLPSALTGSLRDLFGRPPCRFPQAMLAGRGAGGPSRPPPTHGLGMRDTSRQALVNSRCHLLPAGTAAPRHPSHGEAAATRLPLT